MNIVSLFSGAGGLDLGFIQAGFDIIWSNDILESACDTIARNKKYFNAVKYINPEEEYSGYNRVFFGKIEDIKSFRHAIGNNEIDVVIGEHRIRIDDGFRGDQTGHHMRQGSPDDETFVGPDKGNIHLRHELPAQHGGGTACSPAPYDHQLL